MFKKIKEFFTGKPVEVVAEVPYKVEVSVAPVVQQDIMTGITYVAPVKTVVQPDSTLPAKKKPAAKKAPAVKKPRAPKAVK